MEATCRQLMLFTEASLNDPVRTSASQGNRLDLKEHAPASGLKCCESSQSADPLSSLLKTCVERSISPSIPCTPVWKTKATKSGLTFFQHLRLVRPTSGKGSSSSESGGMWPTVCASEVRQGYQDRTRGKKGSQISLTTAVKVVELSGLLHSKETTEAETNPIPSEPPENVSLDGA